MCQLDFDPGDVEGLGAGGSSARALHSGRSSSLRARGRIAACRAVLLVASPACRTDGGPWLVFRVAGRSIGCDKVMAG